MSQPQPDLRTRRRLLEAARWLDDAADGRVPLTTAETAALDLIDQILADQPADRSRGQR